MKHIGLIALLVIIALSACDSGCAHLFAARAEVADTPIAEDLSAEKTGESHFDHSTYATLLDKHVDYEAARVDYAGLAEDQKLLDRYLDQLADADVRALDADAQLALLINAYNAFTLALIVEHYPGIASIKDIDTPWDQRRWTLGGATLSLNQLEHGLIRPIFKDSRIHFAVNCASIGCPPLAPWPYTGGKLDAQLDKAAERTFGDPRYARIEDGTLKVSNLLNWYRPDFVTDAYSPSADSVPGYAALFGPPEIQRFVESNADPDYAFLDYDWSLNDVE